jgi:hypothetical protein
MTQTLDSTGYYALGIPAYLVLLAVEYRWARRRGGRATAAPDDRHDVDRLGEVIIGLFLGPWLVALYDWAFARFALVDGLGAHGAVGVGVPPRRLRLLALSLGQVIRSPPCGPFTRCTISRRSST